jgi:hypothetical protein
MFVTLIRAPSFSSHVLLEKREGDFLLQFFLTNGAILFPNVWISLILFGLNFLHDKTNEIFFDQLKQDVEKIDKTLKNS